MFKQIFFYAISSCVLTIIICTIYINFYFSQIIDFSEAISVKDIAIKSIMIFMIASFLYFGFKKVIKKQYISDFIFNFLIVITSVLFTFLALKMEDPVLKNGDAALMIDFYKGFLMPMLFFPALSWFALKPIFFKN